MMKLCSPLSSLTSLLHPLLFLLPLRQEVKLGAEESRALRTRIQLAEAAQKQARGMEMDYEEVIHLLEAEIAELKTQRVEQPVSTNKVTNLNGWWVEPGALMVRSIADVG